MGREAAAGRVESLKSWESVTLDGAPITEALMNRIPMLWLNAEINTSKRDDKRLSAQLNEKAGLASAVPINGDGYFLTAGHNLLDAETLDVIVRVFDEEGHPQMKSARARIVWTPEDEFGSGWNRGDAKRNPDFAILHADVGPLMPFELSSELPRIDEPIIGAGWSLRYSEGPTYTVSLTAGHVLSLLENVPRRASTPWVTVLHDAPIVSGDSGCPLLDRSGNLVGINCQTHYEYSFLAWLGMRFGRAPEDYERSTIALRPDPDWIREVIENDRLSRTADR